LLGFEVDHAYLNFPPNFVDAQSMPLLRAFGSLVCGFAAPSFGLIRIDPLSRVSGLRGTGKCPFECRFGSGPSSCNSTFKIPSATQHTVTDSISDLPWLSWTILLLLSVSKSQPNCDSSSASTERTISLFLSHYHPAQTPSHLGTHQETLSQD
jgi:hypothetical protein